MILESNEAPLSAEILLGLIQKEQPKSFYKVQMALMTQIEKSASRPLVQT